jgi:hypothetical protein
MTTPTNRPADDGLEDRLAATFDRALKRAEDDLADGRLAAEAIDRGHRGVRGGAILRVGLVLAAVAVLGAVALWFVGGRPSPSPVPSLAAAVPSGSEEPTPYTTESLLPTDANGSQIPQPASTDPGIPNVDSFPPVINGATVCAVGPEADAAIAAATDASPILISGWYVGAMRAGCSDFNGGSPAPDGVYFKDCMGTPLAADPVGPEALRVYFRYDQVGQQNPFPVTATGAEVQSVLLRVHVHDPGCTTADCQHKPVVDQPVLLGTPDLSPVVVAQTMPPKIITMADAIQIARAHAVEGQAVGDLVLVRVQAGPTSLFRDQMGNQDQYGPWLYVVLFDTRDGRSYVTVYVDAVTGEANDSPSGSGSDGLSYP